MSVDDSGLEAIRKSAQEVVEGDNSEYALRVVGPASQAVEGTVAVSNFPASQPVSGTVAVSNFPASQPVTGPLTDTQIRATPVPVSGPLTDTQLRATAVPVTGPLTDTQIRATALPVSIAATVNTMGPDTFVTGEAAQTATVNNILTSTAGAAATDVSGFRSAVVQIVSTGTGGTFIFEGCNDNVNFQSLPVFDKINVTGQIVTVATTASSSAVNYIVNLDVKYFRVRIATTITGGSIQAFTRYSQAAWAPSIYQVAQSSAARLNALVTGAAAHSAASSGSPVRVAGRVITTLDTTLVQGDTSDLAVTTGQQLVTKDFASSENDWNYATPIASPITNTVAVAIKGAGAASIRNFVTGIQYINTSATASIVTIQDGSTVIWTGYAPATMTNMICVEFPTPLRGSAAAAMNFVVNTTSTNTYVSAQGYQSF